jgi:hypothetical protein
MDFEINCKAENFFRFLPPPVFANPYKIMNESENLVVRGGLSGTQRISGNFHLDKLLILFNIETYPCAGWPQIVSCRP